MIRWITQLMTSIFRIGSRTGCKKQETKDQNGHAGESLPVLEEITDFPKGKVFQWIQAGGKLRNSPSRSKNFKTLYPYTLSKAQTKGVSNGISWWAIGQLCLAIGVFLLWGKSLLNTFSVKAKPLTLDQLQATAKADYALTPTMAPYTINLVYPTERVYPTPVPATATPTPEPTSIPTPTPTLWFEDLWIPDNPGIATKPNREPDLYIDGKISYFYPPYAYQKPEYEINCDKNPDGSLECEQMASGNLVKHYMGEALACPAEFEFGTIFKIWDGYYTCRDRGGAIVKINEETYWLDILYPRMPNNHYWGEIADVEVWLP